MTLLFQSNGVSSGAKTFWKRSNWLARIRHKFSLFSPNNKKGLKLKTFGIS